MTKVTKSPSLLQTAQKKWFYRSGSLARGTNLWYYMIDELPLSSSDKEFCRQRVRELHFLLRNVIIEDFREAQRNLSARPRTKQKRI